MRRLGLSPGQMISSLRQRNYRLFFFGQLVSVAGTWMQRRRAVLPRAQPDPQRNPARPHQRGQVPAHVPVRPDRRGVRGPDGPAAGALRDPERCPGCSRGSSPSPSARTASGSGSSTCWPWRSASSTSSTTRPGRASSPRWSRPRTYARIDLVTAVIPSRPGNGQSGSDRGISRMF